jgi:hypothetical protein
MRYGLAVLAAASIGAVQLQAQQSPANGPAQGDSSAALQARVRQRLAAVVQQRLALTDDQLRQLTAVNRSYDGQRRTLFAQERAARATVRAELQRGSQADQKKVESALSDLFRTQRARLDLAEQEQRDLAKFLQPSQRAGYLALEEQLRRRADQMRQRRGGGAGGPRRPGDAAGAAPPPR